MFQYDQVGVSVWQPAQRVGKLMETTASSGKLTTRHGTALRFAASQKMPIWRQSPLTLSTNMCWEEWEGITCPIYGLEAMTRMRRVLGNGQMGVLLNSPTGVSSNQTTIKIMKIVWYMVGWTRFRGSTCGMITPAQLVWKDSYAARKFAQQEQELIKSKLIDWLN